jgi:radical SAM-linked protein
MTWWLVRFSRSGAARYVSHLDTARALQRTFARAGVAIALSHGMRPKPRLSVVLPLPVGAAADDELATVEVDGVYDSATMLEALRRLREAGAPGLAVESLAPVAARPRPRPCAATYECRLPVACEALCSELEWFAAQVQVPWQRDSAKGVRHFDMKALVTSLAARPAVTGCVLSFTLVHRQDRAARPVEVVTLFARRLGIEPVVRDLRRVAVAYEGVPAVREAAREG